MTMVKCKSSGSEGEMHAATCSRSQICPSANLAKNVLIVLTIVLGLASSEIALAKEKAKAPVVVRDETDLLQFGKPTVKKGYGGTYVHVMVKNKAAEEIMVCGARATFLQGDEILATSTTLFAKVAPDSAKVADFGPIQDDVKGYDTLKLELLLEVCFYTEQRQVVR
jgi:hypothetical protein